LAEKDRRPAVVGAAFKAAGVPNAVTLGKASPQADLEAVSG
jgi:hypothetical protein